MPENIQEGMTIEGLEIFQVGTFREGTNLEVSYTIDDLHVIVKNFNTFMEGDEQGRKLEPPLVIGHEEPDEKGNLQISTGHAASGWIQKLHVFGDKLIADIKNIPIKIGRIINSKGFKKVSAEIYRDFLDSGPTLRRVAVLGGEIPEIKTLADIPVAFKEDGNFDVFTMEDTIVSDKTIDKLDEHVEQAIMDVVAEAVEEAVQEAVPTGDDVMTMIRAIMERLDALEAGTSDSTDTTNASEHRDEDEDKMSSLGNEVDRLTVKLAEQEAEMITDSLVAEGKLAPSQVESVKKLLASASREDKFAEGGKSQFELYKESLESAPKSIDFGESITGSKDSEDEDDMSKFSEVKATKETKDAHKEIVKLSEEKKIGYDQAMTLYYRKHAV